MQGVYILLCSNGRYYIGSTKNIKNRIYRHEKGLVKSTKNILPIKLVFFQKFKDLSSARRMEYKIKKFKNKNIIEQIIKDKFIKISE